MNKETSVKPKSPSWLVAKSAIASGLRERAEREQTPNNLIKPKPVSDHSHHHARLSKILNH